jgi:pilus assembly protein CpaC
MTRMNPSFALAAALALAPLSAPVLARPIQESTAEQLQLRSGDSTLLRLPGRAATVVVAHPEVLDARPIAPDELLLVARSPGATDLLVRLESGDTYNRRVRVGIDTSELGTRLRSLFGSGLAVEDFGGTVAVRGTLADVGTVALLETYMSSTGLKWVNLTRVAGVQQVQLRVRIAEASRTALRELAFGGVGGGQSGFGGLQSPGGSPFQPVSISPKAGADIGSGEYSYDLTGNRVTAATTMFFGLPSADFEAYVQALAENRYVRLLAEPNLVAVSGEQATFLVGGEFPVPVVQNAQVGGGNYVTIQYKDFGVRLNFRPQVLGGGRIRLDVAPEVSELSEVGAVRQNGFTIPGVVTRRSSTTVELGTGQSFALAGLLRSKDQARVSRVPVLGDLPMLGPLFRSVRYEQDQTELLVMVTADLVEPIDDGDERPAPGDLHVKPDDWEFFARGVFHGQSQVGGPTARLAELGLLGLKGPGAWRRADEPRIPAADGPSAASEKP